MPSQSGATDPDSGISSTARYRDFRAFSGRLREALKACGIAIESFLRLMNAIEVLQERQQGIRRQLAFLSLAGQGRESEKLNRLLAAKLESYLQAETQYLFPVAQSVPELAADLEAARDRQLDLRDLLREIEMTELEKREAPLRDLAQALEGHFDEENIIFFPKLSRSAPRAALDQAGAEMRREPFQEAA